MTFKTLKAKTTPALLDLLSTLTGNAYTKVAAVVLERLPRSGAGWDEYTARQQQELMRISTQPDPQPA